MRKETALARKEIKALIIRKGISNILCGDLAEIYERAGLHATEVQNALSYYKYSPAQRDFREAHQ